MDRIAKHVVKLDAPTRRASPELLLVAPRVTGKYVFEFSAVGGALPDAVLDIQFREMREGDIERETVQGFAKLTSAAAASDTTDEEGAIALV